MPEIELVVITLGSFAAAFFNAAFATGGIYIMLGVTASIMPISLAVPLQPAFLISSLLARIIYFWEHIDWPITIAFTSGSVIGVYIGARVFVNLDEATISLLLGSVLLILIWSPTQKINLRLKHPFFFVGTLHSFMGTLFGVGAFLQPAILRTRLIKVQITSTLASCLIAMEAFKIVGYAMHDFDYSPYIPHIICASVAGFIGTYVGKRFIHFISDETFRIIFRWLITLIALRLIVKGVISF